MENNAIEKAEYLKETKNLIKQALQEQGANVSDTDPFRAFASIILGLQTGSGGEDVVKVRTGEELSMLTQEDTMICLCTTDYLFTDSTNTLVQAERGVIYEIVEGIIVDKITSSGGGGGGGTPRSNFSVAESELEQNVSVNATVNLKYKFVTTAIPNTGTAKLLVNNVLKSTKSVVSGNSYSFNVSSYLNPGINYFTINTVDSNGAEKNLDFIVNAMQLTISSPFDTSTIVNQTFDFKYRISGAGDKTVHFILDGEDTTSETNLSGVDLTKQFQYLSHGEHSLEVYAVVALDDGELESNRLKYNFLAVDPANSNSLLMSTFSTTECTEGDSLSIDYLIYNPSLLISDAQLLINDEVIANIKADRFRHYWNVADYPTGTVKFSIIANDIRVDKTVEVAELDIDITEATEGLELYLTAKNRSNEESDETKTIWKYGDIEAELTGFNWNTNGWINNKLKLSGPAQVSIPFYPFNKDIRKNGKTIEIEFTTYDVFNLNSTLVRCTDEGKGFEIKANNSFLGSEQTNVTTKFADGIKVRISFVIESDTSNRLVKTYINGVLSGLKQYSSTDNFQQNTPSAILINPDSEEVDVSCIRIYDRALSSTEIVNNYIFDINDNEEKIAKFKENAVYDAYNNISYAKVKARMPVVTVTGTMPKSKGDKQTVSVLFENVNSDVYNFEYDNCTIDVQGTSSQYYPRKNWKIKLPEKIQVWNGAIAEKEYTMKADFMESSHTNNIGSANIINTLYNENFPTKVPGSGVRDTMYGFPCAMFLKDTPTSQPVFHGTYMFNNDKGNSDTLGLTTDKSESWEFKNNTSDLCLFKTDDFTADDVSDNLEARYPDKYTNYTALNRVFSWVVSCKDNPTKFKAEFKNYFNLEYCLVYQVMMELAIMVDSRAKNMFLDTVDGLIWYPRFYDMDTAWGLNNEGELKWDYGVEIHDRVGSAYVWDERGESVFWNLFEEAYSDEIVAKYHELRENKLTYDNIMKYYIEDISSKFSASEYNEDAQFKYINPLTDENNSTYLYAAQGNRQDYFRWLVENRLHYLDSKYEYGDFNSDYATMRLYTKEGSLELTTYITEYVAVKYGSTIVKDRLTANSPKVIPAPAGLEFNDTETIIYGASQITDFGDLSDKFPGTIDVGKCSKLQRLIIGNKDKVNTNLISISLGNNPLLREIDVTNCPSLTGDLDVSGCFDLRVVKAEGTNLSSITVCDGGNIEELYLPDSVTTLKLINLKNLKKIEGNNFSNLRTIIFKNCNYDLQDLLCLCPNLSRLNIHFEEDQNMSMDVEQIMYYTRHMIGIDDSGYNADKPIITGHINIQLQSYLTNEEKEEYKNIINETYSNLTTTYTDVASMFSFSRIYQSTSKTSYEFERSKENPLIYVRKIGVERGAYMLASNDGNTDDGYLIGKISTSAVVGNVFLPEKYKGKNILSIAAGGFSGCVNMTSITVPTSYEMFNRDLFVIKYNCFERYSGESNSGIPSSYLKELTGEDIYLWSACCSSMFSGCSNLVSVAWKLKADNILFSGSIFRDCPRLKYIADLDKVKGFSSNWAGGSTFFHTATSEKRKFNLSGAETMFFEPVTSNGGITSSSTSVCYNFNRNDFVVDFSKLKTTNYAAYGFSGYVGDVDLSNVEHIKQYATFGSNIADGTLQFYMAPASIVSGGRINHLKLNDKFLKFPVSGTTIVNHEVENYEHFDIIHNTDMDLRIDNTSVEDPFVFPNVKVLSGSNFRISYNTNSESAMSDDDGTNAISFPSLEEVWIDLPSIWVGSRIGCGLRNIITPKDRFIKLKTYENYSWPGVGNNASYYEARFFIHARDCDMFRRGFDCSKAKFGFCLHESAFYYITEFGGFIDIGKNYDVTIPENSSPHRLTLNIRVFSPGYTGTSQPITQEQQKACIMNIINGLYDIASLGIPPQQVVLGSRALGILTEDEIAIATNKGWTLS